MQVSLAILIEDSSHSGKGNEGEEKKEREKDEINAVLLKEINTVPAVLCIQIYGEIFYLIMRLNYSQTVLLPWSLLPK